MRQEDLYLLKTLKGAAVYHSHTPEDQAKIAKVSRATWYRRMKEPGTLEVCELRRLIKHYKISPEETLDFLGYRR